MCDKAKEILIKYKSEVHVCKHDVDIVHVCNNVIQYFEQWITALPPPMQICYEILYHIP